MRYPRFFLIFMMAVFVLLTGPTIRLTFADNLGLLWGKKALSANNLEDRVGYLNRAHASFAFCASTCEDDQLSLRRSWLGFELEVTRYWLGHQEQSYQRAVALEAQGDFMPAKVWYHRATDEGAMRVPAYRALLRLSSDEPKARSDLEQELKALAPTFVVSQVVSMGDGQDWLLRGYDLDEAALALDQPLRLTLYWLRVNKNGIETPCSVVEEDIVCADYVYQMRHVENRLPNAGFEAPLLDGVRIPPGYTLSKETTNPLFIHVAPCDRLGIPTHCLVLHNHERGSSGIQSWNSYDVESIYLLAAWMKSEQGNGHVSLLRRGESYDVIQATGDMTWHHEAGVIAFRSKPPYYRVRVLNYKALGKVYVDDLLLVPVTLPSWD